MRLEAAVDNLDSELKPTHQENSRGEGSAAQPGSQSGKGTLPLVSRIQARLGEMLISAGTRLKDRACTEFTTDEESTPTYLIML
jgi:hypothetical protein